MVTVENYMYRLFLWGIGSEYFIMEIFWKYLAIYVEIIFIHRNKISNLCPKETWQFTVRKNSFNKELGLFATETRTKLSLAQAH